ncbi:MAG: amino acid adenylation domain-containing protein, partial [bacterium]|nr:amino acid adenylation domain-containing protein [bacterium]
MNTFNKKNIEDILGLTPMQQGMLFHYLTEGSSSLYFEQLCLEISGEIKREWFESAWTQVVEANQMLRTLFRWEKMDKPVQIILKNHSPKICHVDLSCEDEDKKKALFDELTTRDRGDGFDLQEVPFRMFLCKLENCKYKLVISNHHILYDGWSNGIILKEFFVAYNCFSAGKIPPARKKNRFGEYVKWIHGRDSKIQEAFWNGCLKDYDNGSGIPIKSKKEKESSATSDYRVYLDKENLEKLESCAVMHKVTPAALLYTGWGLLLHRYHNGDDIVFGTTVAGRSAKLKGIEDIVGLFINTLPLRVKSRPGEKVAAVLRSVNEALQAREEHEATSLTDIKNYGRTGNNDELFDTILVIENYPLDRVLRSGEKNCALSVDSYSFFENGSYDLMVGLMVGTEIEIKFTYAETLFPKDAVERLARHFTTVIRSITENPGVEKRRIEILSEKEKNTILHDFNDTGRRYRKNLPVCRLFEEQVEKTPDHAALSGEVLCAPRRFTRLDMPVLSYRELNARCNRLARDLKVKGIGADVVVGLLVERSLEMVIGMLAILKAGGAYLPIDPIFPRERIFLILKDSGAEMLLTNIVTLPQYPCPAYHLADTVMPMQSKVESPGGSKLRENLTSSSEAAPTNLAYVIYTSGTTGIPKGVMIENRALVNFIEGITDVVPFSEKECILSLTTLSFDIFGLETILPLTRGTKVVIGNKVQQIDALEAALRIRKESITLLQVTPSRLQLFMSCGEAGKSLRMLTHLMVGGESFPPDLLRKVIDTAGDKVNIVNLYGPTETTIWSTLTYLTGDAVNIGKPIANTRIYILSKTGLVQPVGVYGEIFIAGDGLGRGYVNSPLQTEEKYMENPFSPGERMYGTGDIGYWLADGDIQCLGRIDHQVKIRGFRIEPGEIEKRLTSHERIKDSVVTVREDGGEKFLCAYFVPVSVEDAPDAAEMKDFSAARLPHYMVPLHFIQLDKIPLNVSGKVDRKALPIPETGGLGNQYAPPENRIEEILLLMWSEILAIEEKGLGVHDNFFERGGHSLRATILSGRIHKQLNIPVPVTRILELPTIRQLANFILQAAEKKYHTIEPVEKRDYYPLSSAQNRLYIMNRLYEGKTLYNMPVVLETTECINGEKLEAALGRLIHRHENLRTSFVMHEGQPVQRVHDAADVACEIKNYPEVHAGEAEKILGERRPGPFDLSRPPLLRVELLKVGKEKSFLMVDVHHIITDGMSQLILINDLTSLYRGREFTEPVLQYKDYSQWRAGEEHEVREKEQEQYWMRQFVGEIPALNLPTDYKRPKVRTFEGNTLEYLLDETESNRLRVFCVTCGVSPYIFILAAYNILLSKLTGSWDIVVGTVSAGRRHPELFEVAGIFVNLLAVGNCLAN